MRLIGDIGGTNARFALAANGRYDRLSTYPAGDFASLEDCIAAYLSEHRPESLDGLALAVAGPVAGERIRLTNHPWSFGRAELGERFGVTRVDLFNDFTANALSLPFLAPEDIERIGGGGAAVPEGPKAVLGPGTGLGVSGLLKEKGGDWVPIEGEGGHATVAPATARESAVIEVLRRRYDHVSAERILSGDGLVNLYEALCALEAVPSAGYKTAQIADEAIGAADPLCHEAIAIFCAVLGTVAGNLALTLGASGGVYIAGGIVPRLGPRFAQSDFRRRFESKGRMQDYVARIPTFLITHKSPALVGLAAPP